MFSDVSTIEQINLHVPNIPGMLARVSDALRSAEINIEAICCMDRGEASSIHLILDDIDSAVILLQKIGSVTREPVLAFQEVNKPGAISQIARACAGGNVNIRGMYATTYGKKEAMVYVMVDDVEKARAIFTTLVS